ncbi:Transcriptional regulator [Azospirillaceae bacterium]
MTTVKRILLVDGDDGLRQSLAEQIQSHEGFETIEATDAEQALILAQGGAIDAVIIDAMLLGMDGGALCRRLRQENVSCPILMLVGAEGAARGVGDIGASDWMVKPFRLGALLARLCELLRQYEQARVGACTIGPYRFRPDAKMLLDEKADRKIRLTEKETAILKYLYQAASGVVGRNILLGAVWGYNSGVTTHTLETHVYRLRRKIERNPSHAEILITEPGGYRLVL